MTGYDLITRSVIVAMGAYSEAQTHPQGRTARALLAIQRLTNLLTKPGMRVLTRTEFTELWELEEQLLLVLMEEGYVEEGCDD